MKTKRFVAAAIAVCAGLLTTLHAADKSSTENNRDYDDLAQKVVSRSARIKEGDRVAIYGQFTDAALLDAPRRAGS